MTATFSALPYPYVRCRPLVEAWMLGMSKQWRYAWAPVTLSPRLRGKSLAEVIDQPWQTPEEPAGPEDYRIDDIPGEPVFEVSSGRWQWVRLTYTTGKVERRYFHVSCDCIADDEGRCILCGAKAWV